MAITDLHMHSNISNDGEFSPAELMKLCSLSGLKTVALTDHNSVRGISEAQEAATRLGLELISGIELDCQFEGIDLHLLGYGIDTAAAELHVNEQAVIIRERAVSATRMQLVKDLGISFDEDKVMELSSDGVVTGEMIAEVALDDQRNMMNPLLDPYRGNGARSDNPFVNFYWDFCAQGKSAYVPVEAISISEAVKMVKQAGGLAVLAHPGKNLGQDGKTLGGIIQCGIDGIEVYSSYHDVATTEFYREQAEAHQLLKTLGSDFHGKTKPSIKLGSIGCPNDADLCHKLKLFLA